MTEIEVLWHKIFLNRIKSDEIQDKKLKYSLKMNKGKLPGMRLRCLPANISETQRKVYERSFKNRLNHFLRTEGKGKKIIMGSLNVPDSCYIMKKIPAQVNVNDKILGRDRRDFDSAELILKKGYAVFDWENLSDYIDWCEEKKIFDPMGREYKLLSRHVKKILLKEGCPRKKLENRYKYLYRTNFALYMQSLGHKDYLTPSQKQQEYINTMKSLGVPQRKKIKLNYDYCLLCKSKRKKLIQHHIYSLPEQNEYNSPKNVVNLCFECHLKIAHQGNFQKDRQFYKANKNVADKLRRLNPYNKE